MMNRNNNETESNKQSVIKKYIKEPVWSVYTKRADFFQIGEKYKIDPVIARIIRNRDVTGDKKIEMYLNGDIRYAHEPSLMKNMEKGCLIMKKKLAVGSHVRIISDYDVDGVAWLRTAVPPRSTVKVTSRFGCFSIKSQIAA